MAAYLPLIAIDVTNKCVVVCDLREWMDHESSAWQVFNGSQDEIGQGIASLLDDAGVRRIDDFGGVSKTFLCEGERYKDAPPRIIGNAAIFSFTPKNRIVSEAQEMARSAVLAGYKILVMTVQKDGKYGKVWALSAVLRNWQGPALQYYEDTGSIIDELMASPEADKLIAIQVQAPGYEGSPAHLADRVVSQAEYLREVLE